VLLLVVAAAAGGWFAGSRIKSPAQIAAETAPPEPSPITVPVEVVTLSADLITRGVIEFEQLQTFSLDTPPATEEGVSLITGAPPEAGDELVEGMVAIEVSDRPVFVFKGELPAFRTIRPGVEGEDVRQLEEALERIGVDPGPVDGLYDEATEGGITELYQNAGYSPTGSSDDEQAALDAARDAVEAARRALTSAQSALSQARRGPSESSIISAEAQVESAERTLAAAREDAVVNDDAAAAQVAEATAAQAAAQSAYDLATERLAQAESGTHPDTGEAPTDQELEELTAQLEAADSALAAADTAVEEANRNETLVNRAGVDSVALAEADLAFARASLAELKAAPDTTFERQAVSEAEDLLASAQVDLSELEATVGVVVPKSEIVFMRALPLAIEDVLFERGDFVSGDLYQLTGSDLKITSSVPLADYELVEVGTEVVLEDDVFELQVRAEIVELAEQPGTNGVSEQRVYMELVAQDEIPTELIGASVKITIPVRSTSGDVLAVPVAALSATADGEVRVEVLLVDGNTEFVEVRRGLSTGGMVEVEAIDGGVLNEGDLVVIGMER
jgi:peptidoglycan hydrolase-like protein with peptidoglycan-binding domain